MPWVSLRCVIGVFPDHPHLLLFNQKVCDTFHNLLDDIFIKFGSQVYRQVEGISMGTKCAPLAVDLMLFCNESAYELSLSDNNQAELSR